MVVERSPGASLFIRQCLGDEHGSSFSALGSLLTRHRRNVRYNAAAAGGVVLMKFKKRRGELCPAPPPRVEKPNQTPILTSQAAFQDVPERTDVPDTIKCLLLGGCVPT